MSGLSFQTVNPKRLSKSDLISSGRPEVSPRMKDWLLPLRAAVDHLHSIGYVHNDITPSNIMLDSRGQPVIIDFGSMCRVGESLVSYKRTMEWHDQSVSHARLSNDHDALRELETWLFGSVYDLLFK
jgi:serine/threonine protein kinase